MYEYLTGTITTITPSYLVLDVAGVGYKLSVANPYRFDKQTQKTIFVEQIVREQELTLYGFFNLDEKLLFTKLLNVSGIGPKSALAILASGDHAGLLQAIEANNVAYLTQFPGIGKKTAQQIILDLQGKVSDLLGDLPVETRNNASQNLSDALEALAGLGYASKDVKMVEKALAGSQEDTSSLISQALKLLVK